MDTKNDKGVLFCMNDKRYIITGKNEGIEIMPFVVYQSDLDSIFNNVHGDMYREATPYNNTLYNELLADYFKNYTIFKGGE